MSSAVALTVIAALILFNFGLMIGEESPQIMVVILPGVVLGTVLAGYLWSLRFDRNANFYDPSSSVAEEDREADQHATSSAPLTPERVLPS